MDLTHPLRVVTPTVDGDVLRVLAQVGPSVEFTVSTIHSLVGEYSISGIRRAADRLTEHGLVQCRQVANSYVYRLNHDHLAAEAVITLANLRSTFFERLRTTIATWEIQPVYAALFGSAGRSDMTIASDIDIFIVRPDGHETPEDATESTPWENQKWDFSRDVERWTGNPCNIMEYSLDDVERELTAEVEAGQGVLLTINREGLYFGGEEDFLRARIRTQQHLTTPS